MRKALAATVLILALSPPFVGSVAAMSQWDFRHGLPTIKGASVDGTSADPDPQSVIDRMGVEPLRITLRDSQYFYGGNLCAGAKLTDVDGGTLAFTDIHQFDTVSATMKPTADGGSDCLSSVTRTAVVQPISQRCQDNYEFQYTYPANVISRRSYQFSVTAYQRPTEHCDRKNYGRLAIPQLTAAAGAKLSVVVAEEQCGIGCSSVNISKQTVTTNTDGTATFNLSFPRPGNGYSVIVNHDTVVVPVLASGLPSGVL
jgi:hypothetical protein